MYCEFNILIKIEYFLDNLIVFIRQRLKVINLNNTTSFLVLGEH